MLEVLGFVPSWYQLTIVFIFGCVLGSFLHVVATRFHTGASLNGRSRCLSCGRQLHWYELIPGFSYMALRGRCHGCGSNIPIQLLVVELLSGCMFLLLYYKFAFSYEFILLSVIFSVLLVIAIYDLNHFIIPDELVMLLALVAIGHFFYGWYEGYSMTFYLVKLLTVVSVFAFYAGLWVISRGRWIGLGDAKLAAPLAFFLSPWGAFSLVVFSFWIGAVISLVIMLSQRLLKRGQKSLPFIRNPIKMSSEVPFAPFLILAFLLVYIVQADVLQLMSFIIYGGS